MTSATGSPPSQARASRARAEVRQSSVKIREPPLKSRRHGDARLGVVLDHEDDRLRHHRPPLIAGARPVIG